MIGAMFEVDKYSASRPHTCRRPSFLAYISFTASLIRILIGCSFVSLLPIIKLRRADMSQEFFLPTYFQQARAAFFMDPTLGVACSERLC